MIAIRINQKSDIPEHIQYIIKNMPADNTVVCIVAGDPVLRIELYEFTKVYCKYAIKIRMSMHVYIADARISGKLMYNNTLRVDSGAVTQDKNCKLDQVMFTDGRDIFPINKETLIVNIRNDEREFNANLYPHIIDAFKTKIVTEIHSKGIRGLYMPLSLPINGLMVFYYYRGGVSFDIFNMTAQFVTPISDPAIADEYRIYQFQTKSLYTHIKERYGVTSPQETAIVTATIAESGIDVMNEGFEAVDDAITKALNYHRAQVNVRKAIENDMKEYKRKITSKRNAERKREAVHMSNMWRDYISYDCVGGYYTGALYECDTAEYDYDGTPLLFHGVKL